MINLDPNEIELFKLYRQLDNRGRRAVLGTAKAEFQYTIAAVGDKIATCNFSWLKNAVFNVGNGKTTDAKQTGKTLRRDY